VPHQDVDLAVEGRREQHRLAVGAELVEQGPHLGQEPHVGHAVRLVDHDQVDLVEADVAAVDQVGEPARRGHHDVDAPSQDAALRREADATVEDGDAAAAGRAERDELGADLGGELPGGASTRPGDGGAGPRPPW
jgi:hypothetical protein